MAIHINTTNVVNLNVARERISFAAKRRDAILASGKYRSDEKEHEELVALEDRIFFGTPRNATEAKAQLRLVVETITDMRRAGQESEPFMNKRLDAAIDSYSAFFSA